MDGNELKEVTELLDRHKIPNLFPALEEYMAQIVEVGAMDGVKSYREEEQTKDGMYWINVRAEGYISGVGYAPTQEFAFYLATHNFLEANEIFVSNLLREYDL